jgi:ADP-heptose:LPS heptosyltransferase
MFRTSDYLRRVKRLATRSWNRLCAERHTNGAFGVRRLLARRMPGPLLRRLLDPFAAADQLAAAGRLDEAISSYRKRLGLIDQARTSSLRRLKFQWAAFGDLLTIDGQMTEADRIYGRILAVAPQALPAQWGAANLRRRRGANSPRLPLKIHFFTIVLNGMPFIQAHIDTMLKLPFDWHWHIVEGVASLSHDTAWSAARGGRIDGSLHRNGLSNDGTSEYLDELARTHPDHVTVYRRPDGKLWDGKIDMVRAPLARLSEECLLWEIDVDEIWTAAMFTRMRDKFIDDSDRSAAYFLCHFFFKNLVVTSANTYGNHLTYEWLRVWRFRPGDRWLTHEPPRLCRQNGTSWVDIATLNPFTHGENLRDGLVFRHYAYVLPAQLRFKEIYYGYQNALAQWECLPTDGPIRLRNHLSWIEDGAVAEDSLRHGVAPPAIARDGTLTTPEPVPTSASLYRAARSNVNLSDCAHILVVKLDNLGDIVLLSPFLRELRRSAPRAEITLLVRRQSSDLLRACPYVNRVVSGTPRGDGGEFECNDEKFLADYRGGAFDLAIAPRWDTDESNAGLIAKLSGAQRVIGFSEGTNRRKAIANRGFDRNYTEVLPKISPDHEVVQNLALLRFMNGSVESDHIEVWCGHDDTDRAAMLLAALGDRPIVAICPGASHIGKMLPTTLLAQVLSSALPEQRFVVLGDTSDANRVAPLGAVFGERILSLCGRTTLSETLGILKRCQIAVTMDAGPAHFAAAVGTPAVVFSMHPRTGGDDTQDLAPARFGPWCPEDRKLIIQPERAWPGCETSCRWRYVQPHCIGNIDIALASEEIRRFIERHPVRPFGATRAELSDR